MKYQKRTVLIFVTIILLVTGCNRDNRRQVTIFHAGSLSVPLKEIALEYEAAHPGTDILLEAAGSVASAHKITDLGRPCDIMASSDYRVIEEMLIPDHASWCVRFASNSMVLAFNDKSDRADEINLDNWMDILADNNIVYGRADPDSDPCGYRSLLAMKLAEQYYNRSGLTESLTAKDRNMIRPKETDLLALLEAGALDFIFQYKSVAQQHGLRYLELPDEINLSDNTFEDDYQKVYVEIKGKSPGEKLKIYGSTMVYGVTLIDDAPNREDAIDFLVFMLGEEGRRIIEKNGQKMLSPPAATNPLTLPEKIRKICSDN